MTPSSTPELASLTTSNVAPEVLTGGAPAGVATGVIGALASGSSSTGTATGSTFVPAGTFVPGSAAGLNANGANGLVTPAVWFVSSALVASCKHPPAHGSVTMASVIPHSLENRVFILVLFTEYMFISIPPHYWTGGGAGYSGGAARVGLAVAAAAAKPELTAGHITFAFSRARGDNPSMPLARYSFLSAARRCWLTALLVVLSSLAPVLRAAAPPFRFAWLSDTHVGSANAADDLRASVNDINQLGEAAFVLISGDVTEYGSREQFQLAKSILDELKVPYHIIPGNHDTKWSESGATDFARFWGADRFVFDYAGWRFIGLHQGPLMKMGDGHWAPQDVRWLDTQLARLKKNQAVIFVTHYPLDDSIDNWFVVLDRLRQVDTQAVLCGHGHANHKLMFEGIPGVMGRSNLRARNPVGGYNLVAVRDGTMTFSERAPAGQTQPPWHTLALKAPGPAPEAKPPRPDFSVNQEFPGVRPRWSFNTGYTIASTPALAGKLAVVGDASGIVRGFALDSGKTRWKAKTGGAVYSTPAVAGDTVVVPSTDGMIYALQAGSGRRLWRFHTDRPIVASPTIHGGLAYVGSSEGKFRALDTRTGKLAWEFTGVQGFIETKPLVYSGKVIFGAWDQYLYALDAATGKLVWKWKGDKPGTLLSPAACWPVAAHGKVFIAAPDRFMTAIAADDGVQVWRTNEQTVRESVGVSADGARIYARSMNNFFYCFDAAANQPRSVWSTDAKFGYDINSAMLVEKEGIVFYGTKNGVLFALDGPTGKVKWQHKLGTGVMNTVVPLDASQVLVTDFDGTVALIAGPR